MSGCRTLILYRALIPEGAHLAQIKSVVGSALGSCVLLQRRVGCLWEMGWRVAE